VEDRPIKVTAKILGENYTIHGRASEEHILRIARFVDDKMLQVAQAHPKLGTSRVAVLAAINMADELFKIKEQYEQLTQLLEEEWSQRHAAVRPESPKGAGARAGRTSAPARPAPGASAAVSEASAAASEASTAASEASAADEPADTLFTGDALRTGTGGQASTRPGPGAEPGWEPPEDEDQ
jgi:cell division protein ZapA